MDEEMNMEKMTGKFLQRQIQLHDEQLQLLQEAREQREEEERLRKQQEERERQNRDRLREQEAKINAFALLKKEPFVSAEDLTAEYYFYESDDGCGSKRETSWRFRRDGEVYIVEEKDTREQHGWGGPYNAVKKNSTWLFASDISRPLVAENKQVSVLPDGMPINLSHFEPSYWDSILGVLQNIKESLERKEMFARASRLLDQHGTQEIREKAIYKDVTALKAADEEGNLWTLGRANESPTGLYTITYTGSESDEFWSISLMPRNTHPRFYTEGKNKDRNYRDLYNNHESLFRRGMKKLEESVTPTLFDISDD